MDIEETKTSGEVINKIGIVTSYKFVKEKTFGTKPGNIKPITLLPVQQEPITGKAKKLLKVNARFDCPCCGKGVQIQIGYDMTNNED